MVRGRTRHPGRVRVLLLRPHKETRYVTTPALLFTAFLLLIIVCCFAYLAHSSWKERRRVRRWRDSQMRWYGR